MPKFYIFLCLVILTKTSFGQNGLNQNEQPNKEFNLEELIPVNCGDTIEIKLNANSKSKFLSKFVKGLGLLSFTSGTKNLVTNSSKDGLKNKANLSVPIGIGLFYTPNVLIKNSKYPYFYYTLFDKKLNLLDEHIITNSTKRKDNSTIEILIIKEDGYLKINDIPNNGKITTVEIKPKISNDILEDYKRVEIPDNFVSNNIIKTRRKIEYTIINKEIHNKQFSLNPFLSNKSGKLNKLINAKVEVLKYNVKPNVKISTPGIKINLKFKSSSKKPINKGNENDDSVLIDNYIFKLRRKRKSENQEEEESSNHHKEKVDIDFPNYSSPPFDGLTFDPLPPVTVTGYRYINPFRYGGGGGGYNSWNWDNSSDNNDNTTNPPEDDPLSGSNDPCTTQKEQDAKNAAAFYKGLAFNEFNELLITPPVNPDERSFSIDLVLNPNSDNTYIWQTTPIVTGTGNTAPFDISTGYRKNTFAAVHTHPRGAGIPNPNPNMPYTSYSQIPSPKDVFNTIKAAADPESAFTVNYIISLGSNFTDVYALVVTDRAAAATFMNSGPGVQIDNNTYDFIPTSTLGIEYNDAFIAFKNQGLSIEVASANAMAFVLNKNNTGIALMKQNPDGTFSSINAAKTNVNGVTNFIAKNC